MAQGGWPTVPARVMKPGQRGQEIETLQRRLEVTGDLFGQSVPGEFDAAVVVAVKKFQARHGLPATGVIDSKATIQALNMSAYIRLAQLQTSLKRLQSMAPSTGGRYVVVNIPAAQVEAVAGGEVVSRHAAVVGKPERATPEISSKILRDQFQSLLVRAAHDHPQGPDPEGPRIRPQRPGHAGVLPHAGLRCRR